MLPQHGADKWDSPSALSKHGGAALRAGRGRGPAVTKPDAARAGLACGPATHVWNRAGGLGRDGEVG